MNEIRATFLATGRAALAILEDPKVEANWDGPSALEEFSIRGLAGHLYRATGSVEAYLDRDEPEGAAITPVEYYAAALSDPDQTGAGIDLQSPLHRAVRQRSEEEAAAGPVALVEAFRSVLERLERRLKEEPPLRKLRVFKDLVLALDDYLITRIVESLVHADDLAASVAIDTPAMPQAAYDSATELLVAMARARHGDAAVLRALTRRERDEVEALRVI